MQSLRPTLPTVPVLAKGQTVTGRAWVYVRDDRPFGRTSPAAAIFYYSRDRGGEHPRAHLAAWAVLLQADAYGGYPWLPTRIRSFTSIHRAKPDEQAAMIFNYRRATATWSPPTGAKSWSGSSMTVSCGISLKDWGAGPGIRPIIRPSFSNS